MGLPLTQVPRYIGRCILATVQLLLLSTTVNFMVGVLSLPTLMGGAALLGKLLPAVVRLLRLNGARAWQETAYGADVLCTDASRSLIGICCGSGVWITSEHGGLPEPPDNRL